MTGILLPLTGIFLPLVMAAGLTLALTPLIRRLALRFGMVDQPGQRKIHQAPMPLLGGLAIYAGFWLTVLCTQTLSREIIAFGIGSALILLSGLWDDKKNIRPWIKLLAQLLAALIVIFYGGLRITFMTNLFAARPLSLGWLSLPLTLIWLVGLTNAVNLVDGLDGLAAGVSGIAALTIGIIAWLEGFPSVSMMALILAASSLAFLRYNFHPARIFMGDTGALFLGYSLAVLSIMGLTKMATTVSIFLPVLVLGVPIFDTLFAIFRRLVNKTPIFAADKDHLHHRLLALGLSHKKAVLTVYGVCVFLSLSAVGIALMPTGQAMMAIIVVTVIVFWGADKAGVIGRGVRSALPGQAGNERKTDSKTL
ncbi:MAG: undecaprenyl/decaprenyl-phosphate alpha-N-acetylglucosaminyl 1-phosphate transferase [Peptococcaceae bacterium]|jgi:UDP-GlcNAc:undecaprenyl-phosphate GlcNAc-1-phosphate transferase|nr:undecaprenyl/decaprenyl-phosphate alpha-N-acetylglucosaminyl 1-phosphate transferase [Peptococcaceae bacterium]